MARKGRPLEVDEIGPREAEQLEQEQLEEDIANAHKLADARRRSYYAEQNTANWSMRDAKGHILNDDNDPLLDALVKHHWSTRRRL